MNTPEALEKGIQYILFDLVINNNVQTLIIFDASQALRKLVGPILSRFSSPLATLLNVLLSHRATCVPFLALSFYCHM